MAIVVMLDGQTRSWSSNREGPQRGLVKGFVELWDQDCGEDCGEGSYYNADTTSMIEVHPVLGRSWLFSTRASGRALTLKVVWRVCGVSSTLSRSKCSLGSEEVFSHRDRHIECRSEILVGRPDSAASRHVETAGRREFGEVHALMAKSSW